MELGASLRSAATSETVKISDAIEADEDTPGVRLFSVAAVMGDAVLRRIDTIHPVDGLRLATQVGDAT